jgi:hypothetical protein
MTAKKAAKRAPDLHTEPVSKADRAREQEKAPKLRTKPIRKAAKKPKRRT